MFFSSHVPPLYRSWQTGSAVWMPLATGHVLDVASRPDAAGVAGCERDREVEWDRAIMLPRPARCGLGYRVGQRGGDPGDDGGARAWRAGAARCHVGLARR